MVLNPQRPFCGNPIHLIITKNVSFQIESFNQKIVNRHQSKRTIDFFVAHFRANSEYWLCRAALTPIESFIDSINFIELLPGKHSFWSKFRLWSAAHSSGQVSLHLFPFTSIHTLFGIASFVLARSPLLIVWSLLLFLIVPNLLVILVLTLPSDNHRVSLFITSIWLCWQLYDPTQSPTTLLSHCRSFLVKRQRFLSYSLFSPEALCRWSDWTDCLCWRQSIGHERECDSIVDLN